MAREFTRNMFIMLVAIMVGAVIITFFVADIVNRSAIDTLTYEHGIEIQGINEKNENFTDYFLQGSIYMDSGREIREVGNYHFDFALFWYSTALSNLSNESITNCIDNCTTAMDDYTNSFVKFGQSKPRFETAKNYTSKQKYIDVLGYYVNFANAGQNITLLRFNASNYLRQIAENLSRGELDNMSMLLEYFNETIEEYGNQVQEYNNWKEILDEYTFFEEDRTKPGT